MEFTEVEKEDFLNELSQLYLKSKPVRYIKRSEISSQIFENEQTFLEFINISYKEFHEAYCSMLDNPLFKRFRESYHVKIFCKKAIKYWKVRLKEVDDLPLFIFNQIMRKSCPNLYIKKNGEAQLCYNFQFNFFTYTWLDGIPFQLLIDIAKYICENPAKEHVTLKQAKAAVEYIAEHQYELLNQRKILTKYLIQNGQEPYSKLVGATVYNSRYHCTSEDLLQSIRYLNSYDNNNSRAKHFIIAICKNKYFRQRIFKPPISALTDLVQIIDEDILISSDTIERWIKESNI
jgi:hypothetical protein